MIASLNEGRDRNPGDTPRPSRDRRGLDRRSTKAGTVIPATRAAVTCRPSRRVAYAQRRPGP